MLDMGGITKPRLRKTSNVAALEFLFHLDNNMHEKALAGKRSEKLPMHTSLMTHFSQDFVITTYSRRRPSFSSTIWRIMDHFIHYWVVSPDVTALPIGATSQMGKE